MLYVKSAVTSLAGGLVWVASLTYVSGTRMI